ncbi:2-oxo-4-hydroxy-4-carboxy-5-ureidoimidazoline decarboxylase [Desertivibrio insolitus]|uniref:2-oxo-4-hydroxy-4-carboxy-5-ureidoimidazoline decarboxylase n=1 Tax=Herbiconiux sp. SYSU D00978 TaxID=2812562 RepID=UPI001A97C95E|nr:2-oxo-4-hydroxy-4-carboxy-5-ureidoimidazoline decarboxylase [Herbiconiux sp. SYSU D00978]
MLRDVDPERLHEALETALHVRRWVEDVEREAPFDTLDELLIAASNAATPLSPEEVDEAVAAHPRIGERPTGDDAASEFSRREQAVAASGTPELDRRLAEGNRRYEERFGRVFIIAAAGRTREAIVKELERRLELDDDTELRTVADQLREIALMRLRSTFAEYAS